MVPIATNIMTYTPDATEASLKKQRSVINLDNIRLTDPSNPGYWTVTPSITLQELYTDVDDSSPAFTDSGRSSGDDYETTKYSDSLQVPITGEQLVVYFDWYVRTAETSCAEFDKMEYRISLEHSTNGSAPWTEVGNVFNFKHQVVDDVWYCRGSGPEVKTASGRCSIDYGPTEVQPTNYFRAKLNMKTDSNEPRWFISVGGVKLNMSAQLNTIIDTDGKIRILAIERLNEYDNSDPLMAGAYDDI